MQAVVYNISSFNPQHHTVPLKFFFMLLPVNITSVIKLMNGIAATEK